MRGSDKNYLISYFFRFPVPIPHMAEGTWKPYIKHTVPIKTLPVPTFRRILKVMRVQSRNITPHNIFNSQLL